MPAPRLSNTLLPALLLLGGGCTWTVSLPPLGEASSWDESACEAPETQAPEPDRDAATAQDPESEAVASRAVSVMTWNLNWFGDPERGPLDDERQHQAVREILQRYPMSLVALQEVVSDRAFVRLVSELPEHVGVLSGYAPSQKTALLWDRELFELEVVRSLQGMEDAGRPPLEVRLRRRHDAFSLVVLVVHAKAHADAGSYERRLRFATQLAAHLEAEHPHDALIVLGDFNDRLRGSVTPGRESPYLVFVNDPRYFAATEPLHDPHVHERSHVWGSTVDHIVVSDELAPFVDTSSIDVLRDELLLSHPDYLENVSDHFPVTLRLTL